MEKSFAVVGMSLGKKHFGWFNNNTHLFMNIFNGGPRSYTTSSFEERTARFVFDAHVKSRKSILLQTFMIFIVALAIFWIRNYFEIQKFKLLNNLLENNVFFLYFWNEKFEYHVLFLKICPDR